MKRNVKKRERCERERIREMIKERDQNTSINMWMRYRASKYIIIFRNSKVKASLPPPLALLSIPKQKDRLKEKEGEMRTTKLIFLYSVTHIFGRVPESQVSPLQGFGHSVLWHS